MVNDAQDPEVLTTEEELLSAGFERCFVADEPRLSEAVDTYRELGFEVRLLPPRLDGDECQACMAVQPERFKAIYTRRIRPPEGGTRP